MEVLDKPVTAIAAYVPFYAQLAELEESNEAIVFDYESKKGNKEARSHVYKLRQANAELERTRKDVKDESIKVGKAIDAEAKEIAARIAAMIEVHQVKIDEIEKREADRVASIKGKIAEFSVVQKFLSIAGLQNHIAGLEKIKIDESFAEFQVDAAGALYASLTKHREILEEMVKAEADAAELEELRALAAAQKEKDRLAALQAEAARVAAAAVETERLQAAQREAALIAQTEAIKAAADRREAELIAKNVADQAAAVQAEVDRAAALAADNARIKAKEDADQAAREADTKHKTKINRAILNSLLEVNNDLGMVNEQIAKHIIKLIALGKIPHVSIKY